MAETNARRSRYVKMTKKTDPIGAYDLCKALGEAIEAADPAKRKQLADTIDGYAESFPDEFFWAIGPQAPSLLYHLMLAMDDASHDEESKPGPRLRQIPGSNA